MKPPFPWNGAKTRMVDVLTPYIEAWGGNGRWVEPFLGSGVVSRLTRTLYPNVPQVVGDMNPWLMSAHESWFGGRVAPPTTDDVTADRISYYRSIKDSDFVDLSHRDRALRFLVCLYSAWGNRWQTHEDGSFATPINVARDGGDPSFLLRRLTKSYGSGWGLERDLYLHGGWHRTASHAQRGDLVFLDSPYPETAGYGSTKWDLEDWSRMYDWVKTQAIPNGISVLVCNPGTLHLLWGMFSNGLRWFTHHLRVGAHRTDMSTLGTTVLGKPRCPYSLCSDSIGMGLVMPPTTPSRVVARYLVASSPLIRRLQSLRPALARAAQKVYDGWEVDEDGDGEYGSGGICDSVANALSEVVARALNDVTITDGGQDGDDHAYIVVLTDTEAVAVDIPPGVYETGGGYSWTKREGVQFDAGDVALDSLRRRDFDDRDMD